MRRLFTQVYRALLRRFRRSSGRRGHELTAVQYEAVSLIAYEGQQAYARAREQADYCRRRGSESGFTFWSQVAAEVALRTKGRIAGRP